MHREPDNPVGPKRIAVVVPRYGLLGGGEKLVFELTERIAADRRWQVHVFANRWKPGSAAICFHRVPILPFPRFAQPLSFALYARKKIKQCGIDLIHTHERIFEAQVYSVHGIPHPLWIKEIRGKRILSLYDRVLAGIEKRLIEGAGGPHLLAVSSITAAKLNQAFDGIERRIRILAPGVDRQPFGRWPRHACRAALRQRYGWSPEDLIVLFVGMNFEVKGLDRILNALGLAVKASPAAPLRLLVVGKGDVRKFGRQAHALGIGDRVAFAGPVNTDIERIYLGSDIFILLSRFDTFGLVVLEAMAAGLPVIVSRQVGAKDVVDEGSSGFVVDGADPAAAADRMRRLTDPSTRAAMGLAAGAAAGMHDWQAVADRVSEIYSRRLHGTGTG
jgi:UDP-glucose:(heptosyl)LPS alpha-1,3-glucosyltransferase